MHLNLRPFNLYNLVVTQTKYRLPTQGGGGNSWGNYSLKMKGLLCSVQSEGETKELISCLILIPNKYAT